MMLTGNTLLATAGSEAGRQTLDGAPCEKKALHERVRRMLAVPRSFFRDCSRTVSQALLSHTAA